jgi:Dolichyl-phosphate-mannose-protein mannosyltransferase
MKVFGSGLFGLRMFAVICGIVTVVFVYLLARELFGVRAAIIAGFFMAFQSAGALFSRMELSNAPTPALTVVSFYFLARGLRTRRHLFFVLGGVAAAFNVYYYAGGRLTGLVAAIFLAYVSIFHRPFVRRYASQIGAFGLALLLVYTPFLFSLLAFPIHATDYPNDRFIWLHHADLARLYGTSSWPLILWNQLTRTLSIITFNADYSANGILNYPIARPLEAALVILGLAWALWRWRDTRYALLSIWFWTTIFAGGVLTIEAPNLPRIVAILPVLPIAMAAVLDRFAERIAFILPSVLLPEGEPIPAATKSSPVTRLTVRLGSQRAASWIGLAAVMSVVAVSGLNNWQMYIGYYLNTHQNPVVTGQALYVRNQGTKFLFYDLGDPNVFWDHGDNKFINSSVSGRDSLNPSDDLPITGNGPHANRDVNFMVWYPMYSYLPVLRTYYPEGKLLRIPEGDRDDPASPLYTYIVTHRQIDAHRRLHARYVSKGGLIVDRLEPRVGLPPGSSPPNGLSYPVSAGWSGDFLAPTAGIYRFRLNRPGSSTLRIDGVDVFPSSAGRIVTARLSRGLHSLNLSASLKSPQSRIDLSWSSGNAAYTPLPRRYLWDGHLGPSWVGTLDPISGPTSLLPPLAAIETSDAFLGFRDVGQSVGLRYGGADGNWVSNLRIHHSGKYRLGLSSIGFSSLAVDGKTILQDPGTNQNAPVIQRTVPLRSGSHLIRVIYRWGTGTGRLEVYWSPPGLTRRILLSPALSPAGSGITILP